MQQFMIENFEFKPDKRGTPWKPPREAGQIAFKDSTL
jgi:hypothetical protein